MPHCGGSGKIYTRRWQGTGMRCIIVPALMFRLLMHAAQGCSCSMHNALAGHRYVLHGGPCLQVRTALANSLSWSHKPFS